MKSSGPIILLEITLELNVNLENIWLRVVGYFLINISPSNIFSKIAFVREISSKWTGSFGRYRQEWVKLIIHGVVSFDSPLSPPLITHTTSQSRLWRLLLLLDPLSLCLSVYSTSSAKITLPLCWWWLIWSKQNDAKYLKNSWNPGTWVLIWEYSVIAI